MENYVTFRPRRLNRPTRFSSAHSRAHLKRLPRASGTASCAARRDAGVGAAPPAGEWSRKGQPGSQRLQLALPGVPKVPRFLPLEPRESLARPESPGLLEPRERLEPLEPPAEAWPRFHRARRPGVPASRHAPRGDAPARARRRASQSQSCEAAPSRTSHPDSELRAYAAQVRRMARDRPSHRGGSGTSRGRGDAMSFRAVRWHQSGRCARTRVCLGTP